MAESQPWWSRAAYLVVAVMCAFGSVWWATHDTPPNRAANEAIYLKNQGAETQLELEREHTKQMKIQARSAGTLQPLIAEQRSVPQPDADGAFPLAGKGVFSLAPTRNYSITGDGNTVALVIGLHAMPSGVEGSYKMVGCGMETWSTSWLPDAPPVAVRDFMQQCMSRGNDVKEIGVYSQGKTLIKYIN